MATGSLYRGTPSLPNDMDMTSTPSAIAWSIPARMSAMELPSSHRTLYIATCARGAIPLAVPGAYPNRM
ncbi:hypothetical protein CKAN_01291900 [Cinnamomum micranthum f. kanehirae]|uniref:Uncharacterized protein n=1 Tax=Cinnamomum micranthum f. kanehirae TaxID=337451 RepID=A0A3S4P0I0_9MAGN|nr:hypothetical protein CKAN_01291900 [Cinnamomum micranthum f. kanehirae]